jgi:hypothetical protein
MYPDCLLALVVIGPHVPNLPLNKRPGLPLEDTPTRLVRYLLLIEKLSSPLPHPVGNCVNSGNPPPRVDATFLGDLLV